MANDVETVLSQLETLDRAPFRKLLALLIGEKPSRAAVARFANRSPDRWSQAVSTIAALAGYERGALFQVNLFNVKQLSDSELLAEAQKHGIVIEGEVLPSDEGRGAPEAVERGALNMLGGKGDIA